MVILLLMIGMFILSWAAAEMAKAREGEREREVLSLLLCVSWVFAGPRPESGDAR